MAVPKRVNIDPAKSAGVSITGGLTNNLPQLPGLTPSEGAAGGPSFWSQAGAIASDVAPFASNIINSFRKPPKPIRPTKNGPLSLGRVDYSADSAETERQVRGANLGATKALDGNTAEAVQSANLATKLGAFSRINQNEQNVNTQIGNQERGMNAQISAGNNQMENQYNQQLVEQQIAQQRAQSQNIANASDKFVAIENEKGKRNLDLTKAAWIKDIYRNSGVLDRSEDNVKKTLAGTGLSSFGMGGRLPKKVSLKKSAY